eukprot:scaffold198828_cov50-Tisochrysis_lutea.AAC.1
MFSHASFTLYSAFEPGDTSLVVESRGKATRAGTAFLHAAAEHPRLRSGTTFVCKTASVAVDTLADIPPGPACFVGVLIGRRKTQVDKYLVCFVDVGKEAVCVVTLWTSLQEAAVGYGFKHTVDCAKRAETSLDAMLLQKSADAFQTVVLTAVKNAKEMEAPAVVNSIARKDQVRAAYLKNEGWPHGFGDCTIRTESEKLDGDIRLQVMVAIAKEKHMVNKGNRFRLAAALKASGESRRELLVDVL